MLILIAWSIVCGVCVLMMKRSKLETLLLRARLTVARWRYKYINETVLSMEDEQTKLIEEMNDLCDRLARRIQAEAYDRV